jgi:hypothetical protein
MTIIRVFPRRTNQTPVDPFSFVGSPRFKGFTPQADEVHVSCTFSWDVAKALYLQQAWQQYYPIVKIGGLAFGSVSNGFRSGMYVRQGVTFTSRGCNNQCPWCLVPEGEGKLREIPIVEGNIVQDNNLLQCNRSHIEKVFQMLRKQKAVQLAGGLDSRCLKDWMVEKIKSIKLNQLFLACDTANGLGILEKSVKKLGLSRDKTRCFVMIAYNGETMEQAEQRLRDVWNVGCMPFCQLYQPKEKYIKYDYKWTQLARRWQRPAIMRTMMRHRIPLETV